MRPMSSDARRTLPEEVPHCAGPSFRVWRGSMKRTRGQRVHASDMGEETRGLESERAATTDFASFFASESLRLGRALYLLTGDAGEAEELTQEALVRVYERWGRVRA